MESRLQREQQTVKAMVELYCKNNHSTGVTPCSQCDELIKYAAKRVECCTFGADKPICGKCKIHCYKPEMRAKIREVMKTTGYKLIFYHPVMFLDHLVDLIRY